MDSRIWVGFAVALAAVCVGCGSPEPEAEAESEAAAAATQEAVAERISPAVRPDLEALTQAEPTAEGAEGLGIAMLLYRHLDESAYFYALAVERDPGNPALMTSLGALALELEAAGRPLSELGVAEIVELQRAALALEPGDPAILNNLAAALRRQGGAPALAEALDLQQRAVAADPDDDFLGARLAEILMEAGQEDLARQALTRAFLADPTSLSVAWVDGRSFDGNGVAPAQNVCTVDFNCDQICPQGIIGRIDYVTCEMENASAVSACQAGEPFATSFECEAQMPRFGILIPGLDPGFSIVTPWGSIDVLVQGDGRIDVRAQIRGPALVGPARSFFSASGSYQPSSGEIRVRGGTGVSISMPATNNTAIDTFNSFGLGPSIRGNASARLHYDLSRPISDIDIGPSINAFRGRIVG